MHLPKIKHQNSVQVQKKKYNVQHAWTAYVRQMDTNCMRMSDVLV
jgi:hypothetical protein